MLDRPSIVPQPNGLLTFVDSRGVRVQDLCEDEVVRLRVKEARAAIVAQTRQVIAQVQSRDQRSPCDPPKCPQCGSPTQQNRRSMLGVSGTCQAAFHEAGHPGSAGPRT